MNSTINSIKSTMKNFTIFIVSLVVAPLIASSQCTISSPNPGNSNATSCVCPGTGNTVCDLVPDISIAKLPLNQTSNYTEYAQVCSPPCNGNDGRLRIGVSTPIIGYGPLESRGTSWYVCGTDTINAGTVANIPSVCPVTGQAPKQLINQRIYRKNGNEMTYWERPAGSMTYHASHGHQHVDGWGLYTLRNNNGDPNPLNWPIIGTGTKLGYCLIDLGNCNSSSGYCTDSAGNTLNSSNIKNYGLGGGNYGCNNTLQGITNGYMDTYSQNLDGMWVNIPPGTCNGTYWVVVQVDPYNYFLETNENNNVVAVPITLTKQATSSTATISANKTMPICASENVILTASAGSSYLWNNGATTQNITVSGAGSFTVTVTNTCGTTTSSPFAVTTTGPSAPTTNNASVCGSGSMTLTASGSGTINWFSNASGGSSLGSGNSFVTPVLTTTTTYYAEASVTTGGQSLYCPPASNTIGSGAQHTGSQYLSFNVTNACTLKSVKIYANVAGTFTVQLQNSGGSLITSSSVTVPAGESRINLNYSLTPGTGYRLTRSGSFSLYRNNGGVSYPYNVTNYVSITGSSGGSGFYYFFYDWEVTTPVQTCYSSRTAAVATVNSNPNVTLSPSSSVCAGSSTVLNAGGATSYSWSPASGLSSTSGSSVTATPAATTTYTVTGTAANGCTGTNSVEVTVNANPNVTVSPSSSVCAGNSTVLNAGGAASYSWSPASGLSSTSGSNVTATPAATTTYTVTGTAANGCTGINSVTVTVNANPNVSVSPSSSVCAGNSTVLNAGGAASYSWSPASGLSSTSGSSVTATPASTTAYTVTGTAANGCTGTNSVTVTVNGNPVVSFSGLASSYNVSSPTATLTGNPSGGIFSGPGISGNTFDPSAAGVGGPYNITYSYTDGNGCSGSEIKQTEVLNCAAPATPGSISGNGYVCPGTNGISYSIAAVSGASGYSWSLPNGATIASGAGSNSITVDYSGSFTNSSLCVTADNNCGNSVPKCKTIKVDIPSRPASITGQTKGVCNSTESFSVNPVFGATNYSWSIPAGATIISGSGTNNVQIQFQSGFVKSNICVTAENYCGISPSRCVTIDPVPAKPGTIYGPSSMCANQNNISYSVDPVQGASSYNWIIPGAVTLVSGQGTNSIVVNFHTSSRYIKVKSVNACGSSSAASLYVTVNDCNSINVPLGTARFVNISPNPASNQAHIQINSDVDGKGELSVSDLLGKQVMKKSLEITRGFTSVPFDVSHFQKGIYFLTLRINYTQQSLKLIVE